MHYKKRYLFDMIAWEIGHKLLIHFLGMDTTSIKTSTTREAIDILTF